MTELETKIRAAIEEKETKIIPENIAQGVTIFGIEGIIGAGSLTDLEYARCLDLAEDISGVNTPPYVELNYIESTGTQYIDTGYKANGHVTFEYEVIETKHGVSNWNMAFGVRDAEGMQLLSCFNSAGKPGGDYGNEGGAFEAESTTLNVQNTRLTLRTEIVDTNYNMYINDTLYTTTPLQTFNTELNIYLFTFNNNYVADIRNCGFKIYKCKIYDNGVLVRDLVPSIERATNKICMYDKVTSTFYYNAGSSDFISGGVI